MKNYTAQHLYELYDYRPDWSSDEPIIPTTRELEGLKRSWVKDLESDPDESDMKTIAKAIDTMDYGNQDEMLDYLERLNGRFGENLEAICNSATILDKILSDESMTKEEIIDWIDCARDTLVGTLPQTQSIKMWDQARIFHKGIRDFISKLPLLQRRRLKVNYQDGHANHLVDDLDHLSTYITVRGGSISVTDKEECLKVSSDYVTYQKDSNSIKTITLKVLNEVFMDWVHPTDEEISLYEMLYGHHLDIRSLIAKLELDINW